MNDTRATRGEFLEQVQELKEEIADLSLVASRRMSGLAEENQEENFPIDVLPARMRAMVLANSEAFGVPPELGAIAALAVISASAGKGIQVNFRNMLSRPNLYFVIGAESGGGKSKTLRSIVSPLVSLQFDATEQWEMDGLAKAVSLQGYLEEEIRELKKKFLSELEYVETRSALEGRLQGAKAAAQNPHILICEDTSEEAFVERLAASQGCTFSFSADAAKPIDNLFGRISSMVDESHYLKAFSGDPIIKDRIGRKASSVKDPCASLLWVTTPDRLQPILLNDTLMRGGFIARCLCATIEIKDREMTMEPPPAIPFDISDRWNGTVIDIVNSYRLASEEAQKTISCEYEALELFVEFNNETVRRGPELKEIREVARRWTELAVRTALVLHLAHHAGDAHRYALSSEHAFGAINIVQWFGRRQIRATKDAIWERAQERLWKVWEHIQRVANADGDWRIYPGQFCRGHRGSRKICANASEAKETLCQLVSMERLYGPFNDDFPKNRSIFFEVSPTWRGKRS